MELRSRQLFSVTSLQNTSVWRIVAVISLVTHVFLFWVSTFSLREGVSIIYWQRFSNPIIYLRILTFFIGLAALWVSDKTKGRIWAIFVIFGICVIFGFIYFSSFFIVNIVSHIGTVELSGKVYQLVSISKYDDETVYYLGICDRNSF